MTHDELDSQIWSLAKFCLLKRMKGLDFSNGAHRNSDMVIYLVVIFSNISKFLINWQVIFDLLFLFGLLETMNRLDHLLVPHINLKLEKKKCVKRQMNGVGFLYFLKIHDESDCHRVSFCLKRRMRGLDFVIGTHRIRYGHLSIWLFFFPNISKSVMNR